MALYRVNTASLHCADIYNESIGPLSGYGDVIWPFNLALRTEHVRDAVNTLALLEESEMDRTYLIVPHDGSQDDRLVEAMKASHERTVAYGQRDANHACKKCIHAWEDKDGKRWRITAAVTDGITIGRPCCSRHNCKNPLLSNRDRFCPEHSEESKICAISECYNSIQAGRLTCHDPAHQAVEAHHRAKGQAMFQLKARLERARVSHPTGAFSTDNQDDVGDEAEVEVPLCPDKPTQGNRRAKARFGRRWTHNEQIIVRCCGYIISHCTLYGSEALNSVKEFIEASFPEPGTMPNYLFYDNNCSLSKLIQSQGSHAFDRTGLPVDVFHFEKKHSQNDVYCQRHCNPASFPELMDGDKWVFNSSIAEQTNVWLGGYHAIVREMTAVQYDFFLDLMIRKRNEVTIRRLGEAGFDPCFVNYSSNVIVQE